jgi:hypothetical protein
VLAGVPAVAGLAGSPSYRPCWIRRVGRPVCRHKMRRLRGNRLPQQARARVGSPTQERNESRVTLCLADPLEAPYTCQGSVIDVMPPIACKRIDLLILGVSDSNMNLSVATRTSDPVVADDKQPNESILITLAHSLFSMSLPVISSRPLFADVPHVVGGEDFRRSSPVPLDRQAVLCSANDRPSKVLGFHPIAFH